jgi:hypothetical protein
MIIDYFALVIDPYPLMDSEIVFKLFTKRPVKRSKEINDQ